MKTYFVSISLALAFTAAAVAPGTAVIDKKAADLFAKSLAASGGVKAAKKIHSRIMTGTMNFNQMGEWPMVLTSKAPNFHHTAVTVPEWGVVTEGCDGIKAWKKEPGKPLQMIKGLELFQKKREARFYRGIELMTQYQSLRHLGQRKIKGKLYDVIAATYEDDPDMMFFLHADNHLLGIMEMPGTNDSKLTITLGDYRKIDAQLMPFSYDLLIESPHMDAPMIIKMAFNKVVHNQEVDDSLFAVPGSDDKAANDKLAVP